MRQYQKKFQMEWMSSDIKPKGKMRRAIEKSNRHAAKDEIRQELLATEDDHHDFTEMDHAVYCMEYGPCRRCLESELTELNEESLSQEFTVEELKERITELRSLWRSD